MNYCVIPNIKLTDSVLKVMLTHVQLQKMTLIPVEHATEGWK